MQKKKEARITRWQLQHTHTRGVDNLPATCCRCTLSKNLKIPHARICTCRLEGIGEDDLRKGTDTISEDTTMLSAWAGVIYDGFAERCNIVLWRKVHPINSTDDGDCFQFSSYHFVISCELTSKYYSWQSAKRFVLVVYTRFHKSFKLKDLFWVSAMIK